jgi:DNA-binding transcriptional regulator YiaG
MTARQVREIRDRFGETQEQFAKRLGVARNTVSRWELGTLGIRGSAVLLLKLLAPKAARRR